MREVGRIVLQRICKPIWKILFREKHVKISKVALRSKYKMIEGIGIWRNCFKATMYALAGWIKDKIKEIDKFDLKK